MRAAPFILTLALAAGCSGNPCGGNPPASELPPDHVLLHPDTSLLKTVPPDTFDVRFETSEGDVVVRIYRAWAPLGVYRFYNLARNGFYDGARFFRVLPGFAAQFGVNGRPDVDRIWQDQALPDDPPQQLNRAGTLVFANRGPNTRATQLFFNYADNPPLDGLGFVPFGQVTQGMDVLRRLHSDYGEMQPEGAGPLYECMVTHGNQYLDRRYPELDEIRRAILLE